jgi:hypothetical protein
MLVGAEVDTNTSFMLPRRIASTSGGHFYCNSRTRLLQGVGQIAHIAHLRIDCARSKCEGCSYSKNCGKLHSAFKKIRPSNLSRTFRECSCWNKLQNCNVGGCKPSVSKEALSVVRRLHRWMTGAEIASLHRAVRITGSTIRGTIPKSGWPPLTGKKHNSRGSRVRLV